MLARLCRQAFEGLSALHDRLPNEELTPEAEQEIERAAPT